MNLVPCRTTAAAVLFLCASGLWAQQNQQRFPAGRLIRQEITWQSDDKCFEGQNVQPPAPNSVTLLGGQRLPQLIFPGCSYSFNGSNSGQAIATFRFDRFLVNFPERTSAGRIEEREGNSTAFLDQPFSVGIDLGSTWNVIAPPGQPAVATLSYDVNTDPFPSAATCRNEILNQGTGGSPTLGANCTWDRLTGPSQGRAGMQVTFNTVINFRFGPNGGQHTVRMRTTYDFGRLYVSAIEAVQAVQTENNDVPLIAGKATVVRVYVTGTAQTQAFVRLRALRSGTPLGEIDSGATAVNLPGQVLRGSPASSASFLLPAAWTTAGPLTLEAEIRTPSGPEGRTSQLIQFAEPTGWRGNYLAGVLRLCERQSESHVLCGAAQGLFSLARRLLPTNESTALEQEVGRIEMDPLVSDPGVRATQTAHLWERLMRWRTAWESQAGLPAPDAIFAVASRQGSLGAVNWNDLFSPARRKNLSVVDDGPGLPQRAACVVGLNAGLNPNMVTTEEVGFDVSSFQPVPGGVSSLMRCAADNDPVWIGRGHYTQLAAYQPLTRALRAEPAEFVTFSGRVARDGSSAVLNAGFRESSSVEAEPPVADGPLCLRFSGDQTVNYCFTLDPGRGEGLTEDVFVVRAPWVPGTTRVALLRQGVELAARSLTPNAPQVQFVTPGPNERTTTASVRLSWTATDADSDVLTHDLYFSTDQGRTWQPLDVGWTRTEYTADVSRIPAGTRVLFQVRSSDGLQTAVSTSGSLEIAVEPRAEVVTNEAEFAAMQPGEARETALSVRNGGAGALRFTAFDLDNPLFQLIDPTAPYVLSPGATVNLNVRYRAAQAGGQTGRLTARTNDTGNQNFTLQLRALAIEKLGPDLEISPALLDFGDLNVGQSRDLTIVVRNRGTERLDVRAQQPGDGFTVLSGGFSVQPGQSQPLGVRFAPQRPGFVASRFAFTTNDRFQPSVFVGASGQGNGPSLEAPAGAVDFGALQLGENRTLQIPIRNNGNIRAQISSLASGSDAFRITGPSAPFTLEPLETRFVEVQFAPFNNGPQATALVVRVSDAPALSVPLRGSGTGTLQGPRLELSATQLSFGEVVLGQSRELTVSVRNTGTAAAIISSIASDNTRFVVTTPTSQLQVQPGGSLNINVLFQPASAGAQAGVLSIASNSVVNPVLSVALSGLGIFDAGFSPRIELVPTSLDWGNVNVNATRDLTLQIRNTGQAPLTVSSISSTNPRFVVISPTATFQVPAGGAIGAVIRFAPTTLGPQSGTLSVANNASTLPLSVPVAGVGIDPNPGTGTTLFGVIRPGWDAQAYLANIDSASSDFRFTRFDEAGTAAREFTATINPGRSSTFPVDGGGGWTQTAVQRGALVGHYQFSSQGRGFETLPLPAETSREVTLTGVDRSAEIGLHNLSPSDSNQMRLELRQNSGTIINSATITLNARQSTVRRLENIFPDIPANFQGYINITGTQNLLAARYLTGAELLEAILAQPRFGGVASPGNYYAARFIGGGGFTARLHLVNPTERLAQVSIRSYSDQGLLLGQEFTITLRPGEALWRDVITLLNLDSGLTWNGSLNIDSSITGLVGEVSFGSSAARTALPLAAAASRSQVFPVSVETAVFYLFNPTRNAANAELKTYREDGSVQAVRRVLIPVQGFFAGNLSGSGLGAVRVDSDQPLAGYALLNSSRSDDFAVVPGVSLVPTGGPGGQTGPRLDLSPTRLEFGNVSLGQSRDLSLTARNLGDQTLVINSIASSVGAFAVVTGAPLTVAPGSSAQIAVRFAPANAGTISGVLSLSTNDPQQAAVTVPLNGTGAASGTGGPRLEVAPASLDYGTVTTGTTRDLTLTMRNTGTGTLTISALSVTNSRFTLIGVTLPLSIPAGASASVNVRFAPTTAGAQTGSLAISSNDGLNPSLTVTLTGSGIGPATAPRIVVTPTSIDFLDAPLRQRLEREMSIRNTGTATLNINAIIFDNVQFRYQGQSVPFTLAPNSIADLVVIFEPQQLGPIGGLMTIQTNDPVTPIVQIPLTGVGRQP
jgi:hypothetical protein